jgi:iron complex outermembrane recepter protein
MSFKSNFPHYSLTLVLIAMASHDAAAQENTASGGEGLEEVVVTAQRREENLQRVPISVTAFSAAELDTKVVQNSTELLTMVPNVVAFNNGNQLDQANYYFRGVGTADGLQTFDSPVVTYVDDVPLGRVGSANLNFNDIASVQVLQGPQGTLFGRNVTGGAVLYTSRKPGDTFAVEADAEYGSREHEGVHASVDLPLSDTVFTSIAVHGMKEDAWRTSVLTDEQYGGQYDVGGRAAVRFVPNANLEWNLSYDYSQREGLNPNLPGHLALPPGESVPNANNKGGLLLDSWNLLYTLADSCRTGASLNANVWAQHNCIDAIAIDEGITSNIQLKISPEFNLSFITGARDTGLHYDFEFSGNAPGAALEELLIPTDSTYKQLSQEIKASGNLFDDRVKYVGGLFFFHEYDFTHIDFYYLFPALGYTTLGRASDEYLGNSTTSYAGFLQADISLTDKFTLTLGGRYTDDIKKVNVNYYAYTAAGRDPAGDFNTSQIAGSPRLESGAFTPKVALQYQFTPDVMTYASYTKGFTSGGWSGRSGSAVGFNSFGDETVRSYEIGTRTEWFDHRVRFNATLFRADYLGLQINTAYTPTGESLPVFVTGNAGNAYDQGAEIDSQFAITPELAAHLSMGFQHSAYTSLDGPAITASGFQIGGPLTQAPRQSYTGGFNWGRDVDALRGKVSLSTDFQFLPSYNPNLFAQSVPTQNNFLLNGQLSYRPSSNSNLNLALECRNCTQHYYIVNTINAGGGTLGVIPYVGLKVEYKR